MRSNTEKESLKETTLTITLTPTITLTLTPTIIPQTNYFGSDSRHGSIAGVNMLFVETYTDKSHLAPQCKTFELSTSTKHPS